MTKSSNSRGKYAAQACSVCRSKKTRCDGRQPVCEPCTNTGRQEECSWDREKIRKPRTEQHFEAMRKKMHAFKTYALQLEVLVEKCQLEHGKGVDIGASYLLSRPQSVDFMDDSDFEDCEYEIDEEPASDIDDPVNEIFGSSSILKPEGPCLLEYGNTAVFRFAPEVLPVSRIPPVVEEPDQSYVLYVEGVDEALINAALDWSRYLPSSVPLTRREHDRLLDLLFKFLTCWCLRIIPALFLRDMWKVLSAPPHLPPPKVPHYSPMLHNSLIALACGFSDDTEIRDNRGAFAAKAKSYIDVEGRCPSITLIHALSILSTYHSSMGEQTLGYIYFGMSARISQALGLGIDCSEWVKSGLISEHDRLDRNWAHWTTLSQDVCWSLYVGRDFSVQIPSDLRGIPVPFVDSDFDEIMWVHPASGLQPQPNNLSKTFAATCQLLLIARQVMQVVNGIGASNNSRQEMVVSSIDLALNNWKRNLSAEVDLNHRTRPTATPHRLTMHMAYWWLFILLHRPWYHRQTRPLRGSDKEIDHIKLCKRAADNVMELLHTYKSLYSLRYCPISLVQIVFAAGTVFLLGAVHATSGLRVAKEALRHAQAQADLCIQYLMEIGHSWHCATNVAEIFRKLMYEKLWPWLERGASAIQDDADEDGNDKHLEPPSKGKARSRSRESSHPPSLRGKKPRKPRISKTHSSEAINRRSPSTSPTETFSPATDRRSVPIPFSSMRSGTPQTPHSTSESPPGASPQLQVPPIWIHGPPATSLSPPPHHHPISMSAPAFSLHSSPSFTSHRQAQEPASPYSIFEHDFDAQNPGSRGSVAPLGMGDEMFSLGDIDFSSDLSPRPLLLPAMKCGETLPEAPFIPFQPNQGFSVDYATYAGSETNLLSPNPAGGLDLDGQMALEFEKHLSGQVGSDVGSMGGIMEGSSLGASHHHMFMSGESGNMHQRHQRPFQPPTSNADLEKLFMGLHSGSPI